MSELLQRLHDRLRGATADLDAADVAVRKASATRLAELLGERSLQARVAGLSDPALTAYDKAQLEAAIAGSMTEKRASAPIRHGSAGRLLLRHARYHRRALILTAVTLLPLLALAGMIRGRTQGLADPVSLTTEARVSWSFPDGRSLTLVETKGTALVWLSRDKQGYIRRWFDRVGYAEAPVDDAFVRAAMALRR